MDMKRVLAERAKILAYVRGLFPRPALVGPVAIQLGPWASTAMVENALEEMVAQGDLRKATETEQKTHDVRLGYFAV